MRIQENGTYEFPASNLASHRMKISGDIGGATITIEERNDTLETWEPVADLEGNDLEITELPFIDTDIRFTATKFRLVVADGEDVDFSVFFAPNQAGKP